MADVFGNSFQRSNRFGETQWLGAGPVAPDAAMLQEQYWISPFRHGLQAAGQGTSVRNPWATYAQNAFGSALPMIYQLMTGSENLSGLNDWSANLFREAGSATPQAGGFISDAGELRNFISGIMSGGDQVKHLLDPNIIGSDTRDPVGAFANHINDILSGAASMAFSPTLARAFRAGLAAKYDDFLSMIGQVGNTDNLSFLDYLKTSGFFQEWGLA